MPSHEQLSEILDTVSTVLLTVECQQGWWDRTAHCPNSPSPHARLAR